MADRENVVGHLYDCLAASKPENMWVFVRKNIVGDALAMLKDQPEIIRCKDCKHCYYASNRVPDERSFVCEKHGLDVTRDWFCADGEMEVMMN